MNSLLHWLTLESWAHLVSALLHTLWIGGLAVGGLLLVLRKEARPTARYRWCVGVLLGIVGGGVVAWAVLQARPAEVRSDSFFDSAHPIAPVVGGLTAGAPSPAPSHAEPRLAASSAPWRTWLALAWLAGVAVMLTRASLLVTQAQSMPRRCTPLDREALLNLVEAARRQLGVTQRIRTVVTEQLSSPAVIGVVVPTLVLPLSLLTTLPMEQLRLIVLHELAHVRRGDYLVNLFQLLVESLLFFNPAVWWLSRQIRIEREACCDALATSLAGARLQYAQTLAEVAQGISLAAPAFGARRNSFALKDRIQRLLVPGYHPALHVTWLPLVLGLLLGGGLLCLSAIGARATVEAILSAAERMDRIESKMAEFGQKPVSQRFQAGKADSPSDQVTVSGRIRRADGKPVPDGLGIQLHSAEERSSYTSFIPAPKGVFSARIRAGTLHLGIDAAGYAPVALGPLNGLATNRLENLEVVLEPGFDVRVQVMDAETRKPVADATVATAFRLPASLGNAHSAVSAADGTVTVTHAAHLPLQVTVNHPSYEITQKLFSQLRAGETLPVELRPGQPVAGVVLDQVTGQPIAGAELRVLYQTGAVGPERFSWTDATRSLGQTEASGRFVLHQLRSSVRYWLGVSAPHHAAKILPNISAGQEKLAVKLGPELVVRGRVTGSLEGLQIMDGTPVLRCSYTEVYENHSFSDGAWLPLHRDGDVVRFEFTNRLAGLVRISTRDGAAVEREITDPVDDWRIDLDSLRKTNPPALPKREVVFRFHSPSGASPRGTVAVSIPDSLDPKHLTAHESELEISNSQVRVQIPIGGRTSLELKRMVGYWFDRNANNGRLYSLEVTNGSGPLVVDVPVMPAGALFAKARNPDGTPAAALSFGVLELKRAPGRNASTPLGNNADSYSHETPRKWVSEPLPLGGTYQVYGWRGNTFALSKAIRLTESNPDAELELQLPAGKTSEGVVLNPDGSPLRDAQLAVSFELPAGHGFALKSLYTDQAGRFRLENATPEIGAYTVIVHAPGVMAQRFRLNFRSQPQTIQVQPGRTLAGRVVESASGYPLPNAEVRTWESTGQGLPYLSTRTDANGRFEFSALSDATYSFCVDEGQMTSAYQFRADGNTNLVLAIKLYAWSKAKPQPPEAAAKP